MKKAILDLLSSKKAVLTASNIVVWLVAKVGFHVSDEIIVPVVAAIQALVLAIAMQDVGKEKAKIEAAKDVAPSK